MDLTPYMASMKPSTIAEIISALAHRASEGDADRNRDEVLERYYNYLVGLCGIADALAYIADAAD